MFKQGSLTKSGRLGKQAFLKKVAVKLRNEGHLRDKDKKRRGMSIVGRRTACAKAPGRAYDTDQE